MPEPGAPQTGSPSTTAALLASWPASARGLVRLPSWSTPGELRLVPEGRAIEQPEAWASEKGQTPPAEAGVTNAPPAPTAGPR